MDFKHSDHEYLANQLGIDYATYYEQMIGVSSDDYEYILTSLDNQSEPAIIGTWDKGSQLDWQTGYAM